MGTEAGYYQIRVAGHLASRWTPWFAGLSMQHYANGETVLSGLLPDQAALYGVLAQIGGLGLTLISVHRLDSQAAHLVAAAPGAAECGDTDHTSALRRQTQ